MNMYWPDSLLPLAGRGTHPGPAGHPSREGIETASSPESPPRRPVLSPAEGGAAPAPVLSRVEGAGWVLPILLAVAMMSAGCSVVPLSFHQTLPSTRMAWASLDRAQRSLDDTRAAYANRLETAPAERSVAAYGATHGAYQRWVTDEVRELPDVSQTIAIGGGDT